MLELQKKEKNTFEINRLYNIKDYLIITLQRFNAEASQINNSVITFESILT